jgi:hypothetical protein
MVNYLLLFMYRGACQASWPGKSPKETPVISSPSGDYRRFLFPALTGHSCFDIIALEGDEHNEKLH